ncbi:MAG: ABC-2 family transporter protein [Leptospiraceae bacterium]|nr:ABC-2 family transporter protein [Leptospiraceae bacterium]MCP5500772.1 ABC-2 family transporter protein [Leptospiraceae bacterium]
MKTYIKFISKSFQRSLAYRLEYYVGLANAFLYIFIFTSVWKTVAKESPEQLGSWESESLVRYAILSTLLKVSFGKNDNLLSNKIKSGDIVYDFLKPYNIVFMYFADSIGVSLFQALARALPLFVFSIFFFNISLNLNFSTFLQFIPIYLFAFSTFLLIGFAISSLSFYFTEIFSFQILYYAMITLFSGAIIPLNLFPASIHKLVDYTPFPYLYYYPGLWLVRAGQGLNYYSLISKYLYILFFLSIISYFLYTYGKKKMEIAGG